MKRINSRDPRKKLIVEMIKKMTGARKITNVAEDKTHYHGDYFMAVGTAFNPGVRIGCKWEKIGTHSIEKEMIDYKLKG